jgi:hypothetical protein
MRRKVLVTLLVMGALLVVASIAGAAPAPNAASSTVQLVSDPFVGASDIGARVPMIPFCGCRVIAGCSYQPIGTDCADPPGCCVCRGWDPATRKCSAA